MCLRSPPALVAGQRGHNTGADWQLLLRHARNRLVRPNEQHMLSRAKNHKAFTHRL
jgi:hypothetical protein